MLSARRFVFGRVRQKKEVHSTARDRDFSTVVFGVWTETMGAGYSGDCERDHVEEARLVMRTGTDGSKTIRRCRLVRVTVPVDFT